MYNWMKWLWLLGGWHFIAATAIKPPKAACQFAADDILLYEFCYYNPMDLLHHLEKGKEELSPLQYHIKSLHIISRHYKKSLLRSQIYHGYEELSTDTNYPIWRRQERRSKYAVQLASWQLRSNSPKTSVCVWGKHLLVRAITHHPFKLGSPNSDNRCKRPWLRSLLFLGVIDLDLQGQIELQSQNLPHFELVHAITHHQLELQFPILEQKCILALFRSLPILGLVEIDLKFNF